MVSIVGSGLVFFVDCTLSPAFMKAFYKHIPHGLFRFTTVLIVFLLSHSVFSQSTITGTVRGSDGITLPGATLVIKDTNNFTSTDLEGKFSLKTDIGATVEVSFLGYDSYHFIVGNQTQLNIVLNQLATELNEVVVVGYGKDKKKSAIK